MASEGSGFKGTIPSRAVLPEALLLHSTLETKTGVSACFTKEINPSTDYGQGAALVFSIPASKDEMILPDSARLEMVLKLAGTAAGDPLEGVKRDAMPVNGLGSALFRAAEIKVNNTSVSVNDNMYAFRGHVQNLIGTTGATKENELLMEGVYPFPPPFESEDPEKWKTIYEAAPDREINGTLKEIWKEKSLGGNLFAIRTRIHADLFTQGKALPPDTSLDIILHRTAKDFYLLSKLDKSVHANSNIKIVSCKLLIDCIRPDEQCLKEIQTTREKGIDCVYSLTVTKLVSITKSSGNQDLGETKVFTGPIPKKVIVGIVPSDAFHGSIGLDPFRFIQASVDRIGVRAHGSANPEHVIELSFEDDAGPYGALPGYISILEAANAYNNPYFNIGLSYSAWKNGNTLYGFLTSPTGKLPVGSDAYEAPESGSTDIIVRCRKTPTSGVTTVVLGEFDGELRIGCNGSVKVTEERQRNDCSSNK